VLSRREHMPPELLKCESSPSHTEQDRVRGGGRQFMSHSAGLAVLSAHLLCSALSALVCCALGAICVP
jgi:hypothetical protein